MAVTQEPILSRIDRLDHLLRNLEEIRVGNRSPPSTPSSSGTGASDGRGWSMEYSPRSRDDKYHQCRSIDEAIMEMEHKGSLLERVTHMEDHLLKVCAQVQEELDVDKHERGDKSVDHHKGLKQLIKSCVKGKGKGKSKSKSNKILDTS